jgi:hypothetical protein
MQRRNRWLIGGLLIAALQLAACGPTSGSPVSHSQPAKVEHIEGSELSRVILTAEAAKRLDIQTAQVQDTAVSGTQRKVVPYASVLYDLHGVTWAYTSSEPLTFIRHRIDVDRIEGDRAILTDGPSTGTAVVIVGAAELFGTEFAVGH